jgi:sterol desaturase/sphingolipid hydroxylase (fatty acid hydroxylase superfamily)
MDISWQSFAATPVGVKALVVGAVFILFFTGERIYSAAPYPEGKARLFRNIGLWAIVLVASPLIIAPLTALGANQLVWTRSDSFYFNVLVLATDLVLLDLWVYWLHRAWHRVPFMWRIHKVHHFDEFLDSTSAFRFHLGEVAISAGLRLIPITLLAVPLGHVLAFETLMLCAVIFHHSNLRIPALLERAISRVIITPSIHWVHHHAVMHDTNSNYGAIFSIWDRLFGTKSVTVRTYDMRIGVESVEDKSFLGLILSPFKRNG